MQATGCIARPVTEADYPAFRALLERGWPESAGYHVSILNHWARNWPDIVEAFETVLVVETPMGVAGYAGVKRQNAPYSTLPQALLDHFLVPDRPVGEAIAQLAEGIVAWARTQDFARVSFIMEPGETVQQEALRGLGFFPERIALLTYEFPHPPAHPAIRPMRPEEYPQVLEMGARIGEHVASYPGAVQQLDLEALIGLTERDYREYGANRPHCFLVAEHEGRLVGFLFAVYEPPNGGLLYDAYVLPEARRLGLYRALNYQGSEWLYEQGARYLVGYVHSENEGPLRFLEAWGFKPYFTAWEFNL